MKMKVMRGAVLAKKGTTYSRKRKRREGEGEESSALNIYFFLLSFLSLCLAVRHLWWFMVILKHLRDIASCRLPGRKIEGKRLMNFPEFSLTRSFPSPSICGLYERTEKPLTKERGNFFFFFNHFLVPFYVANLDRSIFDFTEQYVGEHRQHSLDSLWNISHTLSAKLCGFAHMRASFIGDFWLNNWLYVVSWRNYILIIVKIFLNSTNEKIKLESML